MDNQPDDLAERQASKHSRELLTCKHFNGVFGAGMKPHVCKAGVAYRELVGGDNFGWLLALPCLPSKVGEERKREVMPCEKREFPTIEEVEKEQAEFDKYIEMTTTAVAYCLADAKGKWGVSGTIRCPECGGNLLYSISALNGHLHGHCETPGCLKWME